MTSAIMTHVLYFTVTSIYLDPVLKEIPLMKMRLIALLLVFALTLGFAGIAAAQDDPFNGGCFNLSAEDCAILQGAEANTFANVTSFYQSFSIDFAVAGMENLMPGASAITATITGEGPYVLDMENADYPFDMQLDMQFSGNDGTQTVEGPVSIIILDGILYTSNPDGTWTGMSYEDVMMFGMGVPGGMPIPMPGGEGDADALPIDPATMEMLGEVFAAVAQYASYEVLPAEEMMGQSMLPFRWTFDLGAALQDPTVGQALQGALMAAAEDNPQIAMMGAFLTGINGTITVTRWIGADDNFVHALEFTTNAAIDLNALMPSGSNTTPLPPITLDLTFRVDLSQFNETFEIAVPENVTMVEMESGE